MRRSGNRSKPGSFMMDVTGTTRLFGLACDVAAKVQQEVLERYQLEGVAGVGSNKLIAQTAAALDRAIRTLRCPAWV